jgi:hypothetical protein
MDIQVDFGAAQTGVGYRPYNSSGVFVGARVTTGISAGPTGVYLASPSLPSGTFGVYWDCDDVKFTATEDLTAARTVTAGRPLTIDASGDASITQVAADKVWSSAARTLTSFGTLIADIWNYVTRTLTSFSGVTDIWGTILPGAYTGHQAGNILSRIDINPPTAPVVVIPGIPADLTLCRVYGYLETPNNQPAANVSVSFILQSPNPTKSERLISGREIGASTDSQGRLTDGAGNLYVDLQRNDLLTPSGSTYLVTSEAAHLNNVITLDADTFDLATLAV